MLTRIPFFASIFLHEIMLKLKNVSSKLRSFYLCMWFFSTGHLLITCPLRGKSLYSECFVLMWAFQERIVKSKLPMEGGKRGVIVIYQFLFLLGLFYSSWNFKCWRNKCYFSHRMSTNRKEIWEKPRLRVECLKRPLCFSIFNWSCKLTYILVRSKFVGSFTENPHETTLVH